VSCVFVIDDDPSITRGAKSSLFRSVDLKVQLIARSARSPSIQLALASAEQYQDSPALTLPTRPGDEGHHICVGATAPTASGESRDRPKVIFDRHLVPSR
jgi:hypothetical protein